MIYLLTVFLKLNISKNSQFTMIIIWLNRQNLEIRFGQKIGISLSKPHNVGVNGMPHTKNYVLLKTRLIELAMRQLS